MGGRVDVRRSGIDLTMSAPKSLSLLFAFGDSTITERGALGSPGSDS
jgi:hypothetical protein